MTPLINIIMRQVRLKILLMYHENHVLYQMVNFSWAKKTFQFFGYPHLS